LDEVVDFDDFELELPWPWWRIAIFGRRSRGV
jgi:hypothetical protein